ncbi:MAG: hypothetical protein JRN61_04430 [Nitrososphaerota archaeon]|nr:hypothetical protein [Nitrososphaerota archaeon]
MDDYIEAVLIETEKITRSMRTQVARQWKKNRLPRPLLLFKDGHDS